mgnify:CR=1 FL=1
MAIPPAPATTRAAGRPFQTITSAVVVTKADSDLARHPTTAFFNGATGNVSVRFAGASVDVVFAGLPIGVYYWALDRINDTSTAGTSFVALY